MIQPDLMYLFPPCMMEVLSPSAPNFDVSKHLEIIGDARTSLIRQLLHGRQDMVTGRKHHRWHRDIITSSV